jgi:hypothetical protein
MINQKIKKLIIPTFQLLLLFMFVINATIFLFKPMGTGDESLFVTDLDLIFNKGWNEAIVKNISIPYMILAYPFAIFFKNYIALRIVNVLLLGCLLCYFYYRLHDNRKAFFNYFFFFLCTAPYFFIGTNDALFFVGIIMFMTEVYLLQKEEKVYFKLAISTLIVSFFTRELILIYLPVVLLGCFIIYRKKMLVKINFIYPTLIFLTFVFLNIPSLKENGKLSFDNKSPTNTNGVTWTQRQYLAQLLVNKGEIENFSHPSWEKTNEYLIKNGENSLPRGIIAGLFLDIKLTILEFFKDFYYSIFFGFRQLGLILFVTILFPIRDFFNTKKFNLNMYIPYALLFIISIFSLIIISFIEPRWYAPVFIMSIVFYTDLCKKKILSDTIIMSNYFILIAICLFNISKTFSKLL